ncbi:TPA: hypothetical protein H4B73_003162 [Escherichia coli]|nr:hypothetical protein [Escherichia coli]
MRKTAQQSAQKKSAQTAQKRNGKSQKKKPVSDACLNEGDAEEFSFCPDEFGISDQQAKFAMLVAQGKNLIEAYRLTPSDYGNFDARYQTKTGGVQDVRLGGAIGIGRGGNAPSGHLLSGVDGGESVGWANARPVQVLINGVWRNVASL